MRRAMTTGIAWAALSLLCAAAPARAEMPDVMQKWDDLKAPPPPRLDAVELSHADTALIVMDYDRKTCVPEKRARCATALPRIAALIESARKSGVKVIHFVNANMLPTDIAPAVAPHPGEPVMKASGNKFYGTDLDQVLKGAGVKNIVLTGTSANGAVMSTVLGAYERGYKAIIPVDAMPADTMWQEQFVIWELANGPAFREVSKLTTVATLTLK
jgi:nicotinamidase-related amidase